MIVDGMWSSAPHEIATVDLLTGGSQLAAFLQVEHLAADNDWARGITCGLDCAQDGVRLNRNVIVHVQNERRVSILYRRKHDARMAAGTAQVALSDFAEPLTKVGNGLALAWLLRGRHLALSRHKS